MIRIGVEAGARSWSTRLRLRDGGSGLEVED